MFMKWTEKTTLVGAAFLIVLGLAVAGANAQQSTGTPGSPSATTTVDEKQLPAPPPKFGGVIKEPLEGSKTWWPPRIVLMHDLAGRLANRIQLTRDGHRAYAEAVVDFTRHKRRTDDGCQEGD
jgi:hypothetical protein